MRPVTDPQFEFELPSTADEPWTFAATVEVQPTPEIVDWTTLEVPRSEAEVPQDAIDAEIEALRESIAELAPAEGRPARDRRHRRDRPRRLGGRGAARHRRRARRRPARAGELEQRSWEPPPARRRRSPTSARDGTSGTIEVTLLEVNEKVLPAARRRARARGERVRHARRAARDRRGHVPRAARRGDRRGVPLAGGRRACQGRRKFSLRYRCVQSRAADLLTGFVRSLERRGISLETYLQASGTSGQDLQRQMILEAAVSIARELALEALAQRAGIEISDEDVKAYLREEAENAGESADGLIEDVWAHGQQESVRDDLRLRAALDRLVADVKPIAPDLAEARDKLWTPDKEKPESDTKLWTPGSKEPA